MGTCCTSHIKVEDLILRHFEGLKILSTNYEVVENLLKVQGNLNIDLMKQNFSSKFTTLFEVTLNLISRENWVKLCENNFIDCSEGEEHIESQMNLFRLIYDINDANEEYFKTGDKTGLLISLIPYINRSSPGAAYTKSEKFFELISTRDLRFSQFKNLYKVFVTNALVCPLMAVRENLSKSSSERRKKLILEIDEYINDNFTQESIAKFVDSLFGEFEKKRVKNNLDCDRQDFNFLKSDFELIFRKNENLFDLYYLRHAYLAKHV